MKIYNLLVLGAVVLLFGCSRKDAASPLKPIDLIDGYTSNQVDSIAKHYGWNKLSTDQNGKGNVMKVKDFIALMEKRNELTSQNGRLKVDAGLLSVSNDGGNTVPGAPNFGSNIYNLTWKFKTLKSMAYPSLYFMSITAPPGGLGAAVNGYPTFNYDGFDGPLATSDWSYSHVFASASGGSLMLTVSSVGTETEIVHVGAGTYTRTYKVEFKINQKPLQPGLSILATIVLTQL